MTVLLTLALLAAVIGCAIWLVIDDRREEETALLERQLRASRFRRAAEDHWQHGGDR